MNWNTIKEYAFFIFIFVSAVSLIEYQADSFLVEIAGDIFGALALMFLAAEMYLRD